MTEYVLGALLLIALGYIYMLKRNGPTADASSVWKHISTWALAAAGAIPGAYLSYYPQLKENIPVEWMGGLTMLVAIIGILGKTVSQTKKE